MLYIAFGRTVAELDISDAAVCIEKTKFSMYLPEVVDVLKKNNTKSILLLGIEVRNQNCCDGMFLNQPLLEPCLCSSNRSRIPREWLRCPCYRWWRIISKPSRNWHCHCCKYIHTSAQTRITDIITKSAWDLLALSSLHLSPFSFN